MAPGILLADSFLQAAASHVSLCVGVVRSRHVFIAWRRLMQQPETIRLITMACIIDVLVLWSVSDERDGESARDSHTPCIFPPI